MEQAQSYEEIKTKVIELADRAGSGELVAIKKIAEEGLITWREAYVECILVLDESVSKVLNP